MFGRRKKEDHTSDPSDGEKPERTTISSSSSPLPDELSNQPSKAQIKRATRTRFIWALISSFLLLVSVAFVILVEIGNYKVNDILNDIYFIKIDVSDIIPVQVPDAVLINSIAQTLGLHDFYQVGLWGFCQGYNGQGVTSCSEPETLYWFNPVEILQSQLLAGATIALPAEINTILGLIRTISHIMFGLFLTAACLNFLLIPLVPLAIYSRWTNLPIAILVFIGALCMTGAAVIATVMFIIFQVAITRATQLNIRANVGVEMFVFMWIAAGSAILAWLIHMGMCCCCASRRDVRTGRKRGSKKVWERERVGIAGAVEKDKTQRRLLGMPIFRRMGRDKAA
ncbi:unnamed protein product [Zymoseptoria tritici ST99CH_1A5]|uniref:Integral membrane protein n=1 Tax=Zymoseptoria tritici ST99CH_1A5 TaxID=1276529 RepID=A0A1Y6M144_ZYMTR|nr:unnamed protein product [Zymoseptoria tritici ST99CH_1A5]